MKQNDVVDFSMIIIFAFKTVENNDEEKKCVELKSTKNIKSTSKCAGKMISKKCLGEKKPYFVVMFAKTHTGSIQFLTHIVVRSN